MGGWGADISLAAGPITVFHDHEYTQSHCFVLLFKLAHFQELSLSRVEMDGLLMEVMPF